MALKIHGVQQLSAVVADRWLYLDHSRERVVEAGADAAFLLAAPGQTLPAKEVERLGLRVLGDGRVTQESRGGDTQAPPPPPAAPIPDEGPPQAAP